MTVTAANLPKEAKALPPEAQELYIQAYNQDFAWRAQESHADKAAWRAVHGRFEKRGEAWVRKA